MMVEFTLKPRTRQPVIRAFQSGFLPEGKVDDLVTYCYRNAEIVLEQDLYYAIRSL